MLTILSWKPSTQVSTFSAIQTVKYHLLNNNKSSIELFGQKDTSAPIDKMMCADIRASQGRYQYSLSEARRMRRHELIYLRHSMIGP